jgi:hypothetical protein
MMMEEKYYLNREMRMGIRIILNVEELYSKIFFAYSTKLTTTFI